MWNSFTRNNDPMEIKHLICLERNILEYHGTRTNDGMGDWYSYFQILSNHNTCSLWSLHILMSSEFNCTNISPTYFCIIINQQQEKRWTFTRLLIFFFFFNGHLSEASVIDSKYIKMTELQDFYQSSSFTEPF